MQNSKAWSLKDTLAVYNSVQLKLKDPTKTQWKSEYVILYGWLETYLILNG